jgi:predicted DCC family thiol-disulfide oxidoreductase YuxK
MIPLHEGVTLPRPYTLIYDGSCRVCTRAVNVVRKWDSAHTIEIVASQDAGVMARFPWISQRAFGEAMQLVGPGGATWQGAAATEQLLTELPRGRWIAWVFKVPFVRTLADKLYRWFARNRYRLGCSDHCRPGQSNVVFPN